ncbi:hypothetical protein Pelo_14934 [Pelomyxa schiedti]|nr:hypothetical protein Pelo_14934 [Pelomyxa schiedti]
MPAPPRQTQFVQQYPLQSNKVLLSPSPPRSTDMAPDTRGGTEAQVAPIPVQFALQLPQKYKQHIDVVAKLLGPIFVIHYGVEPGIPTECCFKSRYSEESYEIIKVAQVEPGVTTYVQLCDGFLVLQCRKSSSPVRLIRLILPPPKKSDPCYSLLLFQWSNNQFLHLGVVYNLPKSLIQSTPALGTNSILRVPPQSTSKSVPLMQSVVTIYTPDSAWFTMARSSPTVEWNCVIQFLKQTFHVDISSWSELMVSDQGTHITQPRWLQLCSFLSSPICETLEVLQATIDDIASPYNFGFIGRIFCEQILSKKQVRAFLIRFSDSTPGMCAGSLNTGQGIYHLRIFRRWPDEHATYVDSGGSLKYTPVRSCQPCWYVVQKENEKPTGLSAPTLRALVEATITQFLNVWLLSRADAQE